MATPRQRRKRGRARGLALAAALSWLALAATPAAAAATADQAGSASASTPGPSGVTTTPVLSVRRVPGWVVQTVAVGRLRTALAGIVASPALRPAAAHSCLVVSQGGQLLYAYNPVEPLIPASNVKLLTATAVLDRLGPAARLTTSVEAARPVAGVVDGDLYLVGGGDPLLRTPGYAAALGPDQTLYTSLAQLAAQVGAAGVQVITGAVVGDESRFDSMRTVATWSPAYAAEGDVGPLSALEVNDGAASSAPAPTGARAAASPQQAALAANPAVRAAATFTTLLRADGVRVQGSPNTGKAPPGTPVLTTISSPPLAQEVDAMLTVSDDTAAELFTKEIGYQADGSGTTAAGVAAIRADLARDGLPVAQVVLYDGSGLDRNDRLTCSFLDADLQRLGAGSVVGRGLPIAAQTGTLRGRLAGTPAAGRLRAKTGTLDDVSALSGFVLPRAGTAVPGTGLGQPVTFSLIVNGVPSDTIGPSIGDRVGVALASYPRLPALARIEPRR
jgi:D-alanyl-D-alanine carboxypeptidase/D-alanyl-D-alanine-endopeptidase (penicillin-binding protein 4)